MKTKLTAFAFLLLPTISTPTFAADEYTDNGDGTVTHSLTGLTWQRCSVGQTWDPAFTACTGDVKTYTFDDAQKLTSNFAGQSDWRVPTIDELTTIVDTKRASPAINKAIFPQTPNNTFWASSVGAGTDDVWTVEFGNGSAFHGTYDKKTYPLTFRLVRGVPWIRTLDLKDFVDNRDGTVTHNKTGLTWQRCSVGQTWVDGGCDGKATAVTQTTAVALTSDLGGKTDWRLPTYRELQTIVDYSKASPATSLIIFPSTPSQLFWSATSASSNDSYAWFIDFSSGKGDIGVKGYNTDYNILGRNWNNNSARLVRGSLSTTTASAAASGNVDLAPTVTGTPSPAKVGGEITFTAALTNKGTGTASDTKLSFYIPKNLVTLVSKPTDCEDRGASVVCSLGYLVPQGSITRAVTVQMNKAGGLSFGVAGSSTEKDMTPKDNLARATVAIRK